MTSFGPCITHGDSRVRVGVKVRVGRGVSVGEALGVIVENKIGVTVANCVGEGDGGVVEVGIAVGVGKTISVDPPQAITDRVRTDIETKSFFVIASLPRAERSCRVQVEARSRSVSEGVSSCFQRKSSEYARDCFGLRPRNDGKFLITDDSNPRESAGLRG
jgi:hypothetical protein